MTQMPATPPTVGELITELSKLDPSTPVLVSAHYDNDQELSSKVSLHTGDVRPLEENYWSGYDVQFDLDNGDPVPADVLRSVLLIEADRS